VAAIPTTTTTPAVVVADAANNTVSVVSSNGTALAASTPVSLVSGCEPANVAIGPASGAAATVYVTCPGTGQVEVGTVSGTGTPTLGSFTATTLPTTGPNTPSPYGVAVNAAGTDLVVTDSANNDAVAYPSLSGASLGTGTVIAVGTTPDGVGIDGSNAFVANEASNNVTVIDPPATSTNPGHQRAQVRANVARRRVSLTPLIAPLTGR
jgi:DNA-binding beta-propeller fold protein YncE